MSEPIIKILDVDFSYGDLKILDGFTMEIYKGEVFVIAGHSESGKSTILKLCVGLLYPDDGDVILNGVNINKATEIEVRDLRLGVGYLFQNSAPLSNMSVYDNVALPLRYHTGLSKKEISKKVEEKLELLGIIGDSRVFPGNLSYNKKKLVGIARAMIMEPELLIFDEPVSGLDPISNKTIMGFIRRLKDEFNKTVLVTVNNVTDATACGDRIGIMRNGGLTLTTTPEDLKRCEDPYVRELFL